MDMHRHDETKAIDCIAAYEKKARADMSDVFVELDWTEGGNEA